MILHTLYNILLTTLATPATLYLRLHPTYSPLLKRFVQSLPKSNAAPIWIQAASLGEVNTAKPLLIAIRTRWPETPILLTTSTITGMEQAQTMTDLATVAWFPFDHPLAITRFLKTAKPRCLLLIETELWPNILRHTHRANVPVAIVNGRISARHFKRYAFIRPLFKPVLQSVAIACMQTELDRQRITHMGIPASSTTITGNIKFDGAHTSFDPELQLAARATFLPNEHTPILLFGSTRPGDEAIAALCWATLKSEFPDLHLVIAPRHTTRLQDALEPFKSESVILRSESIQNDAPRSPNSRILFLDTMGELGLFYSLATVAVIGGSFSPEVQGHNPIEPAALAIPTVFGPHMKNFQAPAGILLEAGAAIQLTSQNDLLPALQSLLAAPDKRSELGARAQAAVLSNRGAIPQTLDALAHLLDQH